MTDYLTQHSAGGIVYRFQGNQIEVAMIKDSYGNWTFPKGHVEANESLEEAARREISEEVGLDEHQLKTIKELGEMDYWFSSTFPSDIAEAKTKEGPVKVHKYVTYFLFSVPADSELRHQEVELEAAEWVPLSELDSRNQYDDNLELITKAKEYFSYLHS